MSNINYIRHDCLLCKTSPQLQNKQRAKQPDGPFQKFSIVIQGLISALSLYGLRYALIVVDHYNNKRWLRYMKHKCAEDIEKQLELVTVPRKIKYQHQRHRGHLLFTMMLKFDLDLTFKASR